MRIQIGNLHQSVEDRMLARLFLRHGAVRDAHVATHRETGCSTGVGFVEMESEQDGETAIAALHGHLHHGRVLTVCRSIHDPEPQPPGDEMFGPMNIVDKGKRPQKAPERRGLPDMQAE